MDLVSRIDELLIELRQARAQLDRAERLLADSRASGTFSACPPHRVSPYTRRARPSTAESAAVGASVDRL